MKKILFLLYFLFLLTFTFLSYLFIDPNLIYLKPLYSGLAFTQKSIITLLYISSILVFFGFYSIFIWLIRKKEVYLNEFKIIIGLTIAVLFFSYPAMLSYDIFNYIATAKVIFFYHENPYILMPIQFAGDPLLLFVHAANKTALYGPSWIILSGIPYLLGFGNFLVTLFAFKFLNVIFYLLSIAVIHRLTKDVYRLALFALNPLVIIETLVSSHNDIVMMFLAILALHFLTKKKLIIPLVLILLSILIKYATIFLLPVFLYVAINNYKSRRINWDKVFLASSISMLAVFLLSPLREEIYPWYSIWFLVFLPFINGRKITLFYLSLTFGLMLRYIPFMYLGTYFGPAPLLKIILTFLPALMLSVVMMFRYLGKRVIFNRR